METVRKTIGKKKPALVEKCKDELFSTSRPRMLKGSPIQITPSESRVSAEITCMKLGLILPASISTNTRSHRASGDH